MPRKDNYSKEHISFAKKIIQEINSGLINNSKTLEDRSFFWSKFFKLKEMPSHPFIFSFVSEKEKENKKFISLLSIKPTRSLSGVQVVAVMLPPFACPGKCIYCPNQFDGKIAPKSYTGFEPSTLRAQRLNYDSFEIVSNRIKQLDLTGHRAEKIELIFQGSTFTCLNKKKQEIIVKKSLEAIVEKKCSSFDKVKFLAETSKRRVVGITFETRPDYCNEKDIEQMLYLGGTRVELGVQHADDLVYKKIQRGHSVEDVINSTSRLKDSSFKVLYHLMPGLPGTTPKKDLKNFKKIFKDPNFKPDMVKFYPCLVIKNSELYNEWKKGRFNPISEKDAIYVLSEIQKEIPPWVRVMRINRDIPGNIISAGIKTTNLRQVIDEYMKKNGIVSKDIRSREAGLLSRDKEIDYSKAKIKRIFYESSSGEEVFISMESKDALFGFVRLRNPANPFIKSIKSKTSLIRELHVYGKALSLGKKDEESTQHRGFGKELMDEAEKIAREKFDSKKIAVISGLGVRNYYKKQFNYKIEEPFVSKILK
ncbi:MAG TPA: tRNA uridine(34) 5-carboxymethylaminomethyl modification radical SAM/GNAT enzyme Elp3 [archaeon]|nr:tRNA uridine(34) 5-carboxymethylaminomethyl modification radical SAM/GNAT enzyme Elp3 [archaeon]